MSQRASDGALGDVGRLIRGAGSGAVSVTLTAPQKALRTQLRGTANEIAGGWLAAWRERLRALDPDFDLDVVAYAPGAKTSSVRAQLAWKGLEVYDHGVSVFIESSEHKLTVARVLLARPTGEFTIPEQTAKENAATALNISMSDASTIAISRGIGISKDSKPASARLAYRVEIVPKRGLTRTVLIDSQTGVAIGISSLLR